MQVTREFVRYTEVSLLAEIGGYLGLLMGYLGLLMGYSLLNITQLLQVG